MNKELVGKPVDGEREVPEDLELERLVGDCFYYLFFSNWFRDPPSYLLTESLRRGLNPVLRCREGGYRYKG